MSDTEKMLDDAATLLIEAREQLAFVCTSVDRDKQEYCTNLAEYVVEWSDRDPKCCAKHLQQVIAGAANDNSHDRTDKPFVEQYYQEPLVAKIDAFLGLLKGFCREC